MRLDRVDWMILRDLYRWEKSNLPLGPLRISLRELAARNGIHRNTVQSRLAAMRRGGVLEGMIFEPRPRPIGLVRSGYLFRGGRAADGDGGCARRIPVRSTPIKTDNCQRRIY